MNISAPTLDLIPALRGLWKEAFGDSDDFLDMFWRTAFSYDRCRCVTVDGEVAAALYWFDCECRGERVAYIYAVATAKKYRGRGICRGLMKDTHGHLRGLGYVGGLLVPGSEGLFDFYAKLGYKSCGSIGEITCVAAEKTTEIRRVDIDEYAKLRRDFLPHGGVVQEGENLAFLKEQAELYTGDSFLLAARRAENRLYGLELLGDAEKTSEILRSLGCTEGIFRLPDGNKSFAMYFPLYEKHPAPEYFGLAFD